MTSTCMENSTMHATPSKKRNSFFSLLIFPNIFSMVFFTNSNWDSSIHLNFNSLFIPSPRKSE